MPSSAAAVALTAALLVLTPAAVPTSSPRAGAGVATPAVVLPAADPVGTGWQWPLTGQPQVLRPFEAPARRWSPGHRGVDLAAAPGDPVRAPATGVVAFAGVVVDRPVVSIATPGGLRLTLEPVEAWVPAGTVVRAGERVGSLAAAPAHCGASTCLHWGVRVGRDRYLDPLAVLARGSRPAPPVLLPLR